MINDQSIWARPSNDGKVRPCESCGFADPQFRRSIRERLTGNYYESCEKCFDGSVPDHPDVYCPVGGYLDRDLGVYFTSKKHKAWWLKQRGWVEAGDARRGARNFDPISHRHAMKSLGR